jgi:anti-sigma regulatory factor (Ser/Thr protein kinase)
VSGESAVEMSGSFRRDLLDLPQVFAFVETFFENAMVDTKVRFPVELSVEEVFTNFVRHNAGGRNRIGIRLRLDGGNLSIAMTDYDAPRFDMNIDAPVPNIDAPLEERSPGGLGLHLVRKMMDRIEYRHENGIGTVVLSKSVG